MLFRIDVWLCCCSLPTTEAPAFLAGQRCRGPNWIEDEEGGRPSIGLPISAIRRQARSAAPLPRTRRPACARGGSAERAPPRSTSSAGLERWVAERGSSGVGRNALISIARRAKRASRAGMRSRWAGLAANGGSPPSSARSPRESLRFKSRCRELSHRGSGRPRYTCRDGSAARDLPWTVTRCWRIF